MEQFGLLYRSSQDAARMAGNRDGIFGDRVQGHTLGRREFLQMLELRVDWKNPSQAGAVYSEQKGKLELAVRSTLRRGWFFGSQQFRETLLKLAAKTLAERAKREADGYQGVELSDHGERRAEQILQAGLEHFGLSGEELRSAAIQKMLISHDDH